MGDYAIRARFDAACPPAEVKRWLDSPEGIAGWWSDEVGGAAGEKGDRFQVAFPSTPVVFELEVSESSESVAEWFVAENPPWWKGTTIRFELGKGGEGTTIQFSHSGFEPDDPIIEVINPAWVRFVDNLVDVAQSGTPNPAVVN